MERLSERFSKRMAAAGSETGAIDINVLMEVLDEYQSETEQRLIANAAKPAPVLAKAQWWERTGSGRRK